MIRLLLILALLSCAVARGSDDIWTALLLATNESPAIDVPKPLESFAPTIKKIFGYNSLYLLGQKRRTLDGDPDKWLVPSKAFFFQITSLDQEPEHYRLRLELFHDQELLLTTEVKLAQKAPRFIRGPQWGKGQLILLVEVR